jgi:chromosome segregation ATPase
MDADEIKDGQDTPSDEQDESSASTQKPSEEQEKTFTQKEVDDLVAKRHSKLDAKISRLEKQVERSGKSTGELQRLQTRITELEAERDNLELKGADDSPDLQEIIKRRRDLDARERSLNDRESAVDAYIEQFEEDLDNANELGRTELANELGEEFKVDSKTILSFPSETPEQMRDIATRLSTLAPSKKDKDDKSEPETTPRSKPESGKGAGAGDTTPTKSLDLMREGWGDRSKKK